MKDREAILRYLSFQIFSYEHGYEGDMRVFVEDAMREINKMSDDQISDLKTDFLRVMRLTYEFFGARNFRLPLKGRTTGGRINIAVLESIGFFFSKQSDDFLHKHKREIIDNFNHLLEDDDYLDAVQRSTGDTNRVLKRFRLAQKILGAVDHAKTD
jgi:hypothetical protein